MSFSENDRVQIRRFLGMGSTFLSQWPLVESAITAVQSVADGGSRPDSSAENLCKGLVYGIAASGTVQGVAPGGAENPTTTTVTPYMRGLQAIEAAIAAQDQFLGTTEAIGDAKYNPYIEIKRLRSEGRRLAKTLATTLGMRRVLKDVFSAGSGSDVDDASEEELFTDSRYW